MSIFRSDLLQKKIAFVTGGGSGICFGIAEAFAAHGADVFIMGRREDVLKNAAKKIALKGQRCEFYAGDVRDAAQCEAAVARCIEQFGSLDILVNGAAGNFLCPASALSGNAFKSVIDIDLVGTFQASKAAYPFLAKSRGTILNISATLHYVATPYQAHVSAAKAGIDALTVNLAGEWGEKGIRVVGIAPGPIGDTEGMRRLAPGEAGKALADSIPLARLGKIEDIAQAALFLVSSGASFITGETLVVDGGHWLAKPPFVPKAVVEQLMASAKSKS